MLCVSIGTWAAGTISTVDGVCTITLEYPSDLASLTYSETDLAATTLIVKCSGAFDMADMSKINQFTNATTIDMAGCYLTWGNVNGLSSNKVEYLLLPAYANENDSWSSNVQSNCPNVKGVMRSKCTWGGTPGIETFVEVKEENAFKKISDLLASHTEAWNTTPVFTVTGPMNAADYAGLNNLDHSSFNLGGVTLSSDADALSLANTSAEYVRLPKDAEFSSVSNPISGCTNLKVAFSSSSDGTKAYAHVTEGNQGALSTFTSNASLNAGISTVSNWTISGYLQNSDVRDQNTSTINITGESVNDGKGPGALPPNVITAIDLTDAVFGCDELTINCIYPNGLSSVKFPNNSLTCKEIPAYCANLCTALTSAEIPSNYTSIGEHAFHQTALTRIKIGKNVTSVGAFAFTLCDALNTIEFEKGIHDLDFEPYSFAGIPGLKHVVLPEGVRNLGEYMFQQCINLASIRLPSTLQNIEGHCFAGCQALTQITIPENVQTIGRDAFGNSGLRDIYVMANSVGQLPLIYPFTNDPTQDFNGSTFGRNSLVNNNADIYGNVSTNTTEEVNQLWHEAGNIPTFLHYRPELKDFIDYNPWYPGTDSEKRGAPAEEQYLSDTYVYVDSEGQHWPKQNDSGYRGDFGRVLESGLITTDHQQTGTANATRDAWRQFMLKFGDAEPGKTVYEKEYTDVWYTMCFPWHLNDEQLEEAFNAEYNICEFSGVEIVQSTVEGVSVNNLILHFNDIAQEQTIDGEGYLAVAGHPYMIHPNIGVDPTSADGKVKCYFTGIKAISDLEPEQVTKALDGGAGSLSFVGTFEDTALPQNSYFLGTKSGEHYPKFWRRGSVDTANRWKQYTAIVKPDADAWSYIANNVLTTPNAQGAKLAEFLIDDYVGVDAETTDIKEIVNAAKEKNLPVEYMNVIYNINGQVISNDSKDLQNLPKGLYIVNGKKYFVK